MTRLFLGLLTIIGVSLGQAIAAPIIGLDRDTRIPDHYLVVLNANEHVPSIANELESLHPNSITYQYRSALNGFSIKLSSKHIKALAKDPRVVYIEADQRITLNATQSPVTWGLDRTDQRDLPLDNSYTYNTSASNVHVYVIDTGIRLSHNEFGGRAISGYSSINDGNGTNDCNGHGTHVSGTVAGSTYGIAKSASVYAVRVLDCNGSGTTSGVVAGIDWVTGNHVSPAVANMSLGGGPSNTLDNAVRNSIAAGVTYAVAAGNSNGNACNESPSAVSEALTVGSTTSSDARSSFSNWGSCVDIFAPGSGITSAWNNSNNATNTISGTSMASPHVAGIAALYLADNPTATPAQTFDAIVASASSGKLSNIGNGSPNLLAYALLTGDGGGGGGGGTCPDGFETFTGNLGGSGDYEYQPDGTYYYSGSGTHEGILEGPDGTDYDLYLRKWGYWGWYTVASSTSYSSSESISYSGSSGYYVWRVNSYSGSGNYDFCMKTP